MLVTLEGSDNDKIKPQGLTIPLILPDGVDLSSNNDEADVIDIQSDLDKYVNDGTNGNDENVAETDTVVE